jgi:hypothetical protein
MVCPSELDTVHFAKNFLHANASFSHELLIDA